MLKLNLMIKILIADHAMSRVGLLRILELAGGFAVVGEAASGEETLELAAKLGPEIVLLELSMPGRGGIEIARELKRQGFRVLILTVLPEAQYGIRCLQQGVDGYLTKDSSPAELISALRLISAGHKYVTPSLAERLAEQMDPTLGTVDHNRLSEREFEVMRRLGAGRTVGETAVALNLNIKTVSTYRTRVLEKLGLKNTAAIMHYVIEHGLEQQE